MLQEYIIIDFFERKAFLLIHYDLGCCLISKLPMEGYKTWNVASKSYGIFINLSHLQNLFLLCLFP